MSEPEPEPTADRPPTASRAGPRTVHVRRDDLTPEPGDEPTGPPRVLFWFRLGCVPIILVAAYAVVGALWRILADEFRWDRAALLAGSLVVFVAYTLPMWWRRPKWWHWIYGMALLLPGVVPLTNPISVTLLVFWCRSKTVRFFRHPPDSYAVVPPPPAEGTVVPVDPPAVLFALRWMCVLGCGACLLALPVVAVAHAADPDPGWGVLWWLGGFAAAFVLFAVPLFARTPRPWVWWYGLGLLALCSLSLYFTVLAVPILVAWLLKGVRGYYAGRQPATA
jgi:hypothetical protein